MTPAQRHEHRKAIARKIVLVVWILYTCTFDPFGWIFLGALWRYLEPDFYVPPYDKGTLRGKVIYDPRVDQPPEVQAMREIDRNHDDISF